MAEAAVKEKRDAAPEAEQELTDGFHLIIEALKLNGLNTIYGVPGIPITDFGRMAQASGIRVLSFRHEQNAGYAASIAGFLTKKPGVCLTVSAPGFLNGLTALAHATTNCFPMILISGSSEREIVDYSRATTRKGTSSRSPSPSARPRTASSTSRTSAPDSTCDPCRGVRVVPAASISDLPANCSGPGDDHRGWGGSRLGQGDRPGAGRRFLRRMRSKRALVMC
jgi:hypothetical protein